jgi:hypothetical protein
MPRLEVLGQKGQKQQLFEPISRAKSGVLHKTRTKMRVAADHLLATVSDPLLDFFTSVPVMTRVLTL